MTGDSSYRDPVGRACGAFAEKAITRSASLLFAKPASVESKPSKPEQGSAQGHKRNIVWSVVDVLLVFRNLTMPDHSQTRECREACRNVDDDTCKLCRVRPTLRLNIELDVKSRSPAHCKRRASCKVDNAPLRKPATTPDPVDPWEVH